MLFFDRANSKVGFGPISTCPTTAGPVPSTSTSTSSPLTTQQGAITVTTEAHPITSQQIQLTTQSQIILGTTGGRVVGSASTLYVGQYYWCISAVYVILAFLMKF